ncbi:MAG: beta-lactamase domain protein [Anaerosporomusa subterranea]|jgi:competence protein ComEC|nr:beta-lactamase domain protein [Anaerosporomusa subterranea]
MPKLRTNHLIISLLMILLLLVSACGNAPAAEPKSRAKLDSNAAANLTVKVLDVGQADAILIQTPKQAILIDTGDVGTKEKLVSYIKKAGITALDKVIITHAHADHLGGMAELMENIPIKQVYDSAFPATTATYRNYLTTVQKKKIPFSRLQAGGSVDLGDGISLKAFAPEKEFIKGSDSDVNNSSIALKLSYGDFSMLLTGDAETESEELMLKSFRADLKSQVLKSPHHGSRTSSSQAFLKAVAPEAVVISVGANNDYHHPHPSIMKRYQDAKMKIYRTDLDGTVTITSDGKTYKIAKEK